MARKRQIKPEFFDDLTLADIDIQARFLYVGMWCFMDGQALIDADPRFIRSKVFPHDEKLKASTVKGWLDQLVKAKRLYLFHWQGRNLYFAPKMPVHQRIFADELRRYNVPPEFLSSLIDDAKNNSEPRGKAREESGSVTSDVEEEGISFGKESLREKPFVPDLEGIYLLYPKRENTGKGKGLDLLRSQIKTPDDESKCKKAAKNYALYINQRRNRPDWDDSYIKQFKTWANSKEWPEWVEFNPNSAPPPRQSGAAPVGLKPISYGTTETTKAILNEREKARELATPIPQELLDAFKRKTEKKEAG